MCPSCFKNNYFKRARNCIGCEPVAMQSFPLHASAAVVPRAARALFSSSPHLIFNLTPCTLETFDHFSIGFLKNKRHHNRCYCYRFNGSVAELRSPDLVALEYAELNLKEKVGELGHVRIRQHVNPLSASFTTPVEVPNWNEVYGDPMLPLMVDIGSGSGRFLIWLAKRFPNSKNYLGLEIRDKLVKRAQFWVKELALNNVHFMFANALVSFEQLVSSYPGPLMLVTILCPDPHFKKRHHKRRVLQKPLVDSILKNLHPGGQVFLQSDVFEVALDMRNQFDSHSDVLEHITDTDPSVSCDNEGWLLTNPMGIRTEREIHAEFGGAKIYRRMYQRRI